MKELERMERGNDEIPDVEASTQFWREIWEKVVKQTGSEGLSRWKKGKQANIHMIEMLRRQVKLTNQKPPEPDGVQGFLL